MSCRCTPRLRGRASGAPCGRTRTKGARAFDPGRISAQARCRAERGSWWWPAHQRRSSSSPSCASRCWSSCSGRRSRPSPSWASRLVTPPPPLPASSRWPRCDQILVVDPSSGTSDEITDPTPHDAFPVWSPDGTRLALSQHDGRGTIQLIDADGGNRHSIVDDLTSGYPVAWSPDGSRIAFVGYHYPGGDESGALHRRCRRHVADAARAGNRTMVRDRPPRLVARRFDDRVRRRPVEDQDDHVAPRVRQRGRCRVRRRQRCQHLARQGHGGRPARLAAGRDGAALRAAVQAVRPGWVTRTSSSRSESAMAGKSGRWSPIYAPARSRYPMWLDGDSFAVRPGQRPVGRRSRWSTGASRSAIPASNPDRPWVCGTGRVGGRRPRGGRWDAGGAKERAPPGAHGRRPDDPHSHRLARPFQPRLLVARRPPMTHHATFAGVA